MKTDEVSLGPLSQVIREAGRPVHINVLDREAARAWLEADGGARQYAPGAHYGPGETVLLEGQPTTVKSVLKGCNPIQGVFTILKLLLPDGKERLMAADVPGARSDERRVVTDAQVDETLRQRGTELRKATLAALEGDVRFSHVQTPQGDLWSLAEMLLAVTAVEVGRAIAALPKHLVDQEPVSLTTEELVRAVWGLEDDGGPEYALQAFAMVRALGSEGAVTNLRGRWVAAEAWRAFTERQALDVPRVRSQVEIPEGLEPPSAADIERQELAEAAGEEGEISGPEEEMVEGDLETWRLNRLTQAVFTLRARHYYEGWLPLTGQLRRLFPPLTSGRQEAVFHHRFGDEPEAFRAWVDRNDGRIWVTPAMYETFRRHRIYPGARLRVSARNEQEYDIGTRETEKTDPIRVYRIWLDDAGTIQGEAYEEPRRYDIEDDVYVADVRFEDRKALRAQAESVGASIYKLMFDKAVEWWEAGGREDLAVTAGQLFDAIHPSEEGRMTSKATIAWELWKRLAFEPKGNGHYSFRPQFGSAVRSAGPAPRPRRVRRPPRSVDEFWAEITRLAGQGLHTLGQEAAFDVVRVDDAAVRIRVASSGNPYSIYRRELADVWEILKERGELSQTAIREELGYPNPTYVAAILAALPDVAHQAGPIRLTYQRPPKELHTPPPAAVPPTSVTLEPGDAIPQCWAEISRLAGRQLRTLDEERPFKVLKVDDSGVQIRRGPRGTRIKIGRQ